MIVVFALLFVSSNAYLAIPQRARPVCHNCSTKGYDIVPTGTGIWAFTDGAYWALAVLNTHRNTVPKTLTIVDAWQGDGYLLAIQDLLHWTGATTVKYLVYSHAHTDHIGNAGALKRAYPQAKIIGHRRTNLALQFVNHSIRPFADIIFPTNYSLTEAGLELAYYGPSHSICDIAIYHPASKTLMFVDVVFPRWIPFWNIAIAQDIPGFYRVIDTILAYNFTTFVGGHLTRLGDRADVLEFQAYMNDVKNTAAAIMPTLDFATIATAAGVFDPTSVGYGNFWAAFNTLLDTGATKCVNQVVPRWKAKLGATDVWTYSHCFALLEALRVDF